jgi:carboxymethylenebutenolidase
MDAFGMRPAFQQMAQRLADAGYLVLLPDLLYRNGPYEPLEPRKVVADPDFREKLMKSVKSLDRDRKISDGTAFVNFLAGRMDVKGTRYAAAGYCMGGNIALTLAGALPDKFAAIASFHGGNLASDQPDSPHQFLNGSTARVYVAGATEDSSFDEKQKLRLEQALTAGGIPHQVETYPARHGFAVPDSPAFDQSASDRHWSALFALLGDAF